MKEARADLAENPWAQAVHQIDRDLYVRCVLACYRITPTTDGHLRHDDGVLAARIYDDGVSIELLQAALILAAARRSLRKPGEPGHAPIRSLRYFLPLIEEIRTTPIEPEYIRHLESRLIRLDADARQQS